MCYTWLAENTRRKKSPSGHHCTTVSGCIFQLRHVSTIRKKIVKQQYLLHLSSQHGKLRPTNGWDLLASLGHPSKFQRVLCLAFVTAATLLTGGQPKLFMVFGRLLGWYTICIYTFLGAQCKIHFASKSCVLLYWQRYCMALQQRASDKLCGVVQGMELRNFCRRRQLYSAGRPSRWASAHILVFIFFNVVLWNRAGP